MPKWLQYYIGGGSLGTPKSDYVICARPLAEFTHFVQFEPKEGQITDNDAFLLFITGENSLDWRVFSV